MSVLAGLFEVWFAFAGLALLGTTIHDVFECIRGMDRLRRTAGFRKDANWDTVTPLEGPSSYEAIVVFTDGTRYRTRIGTVSGRKRKPLGREYVEWSYSERDLMSAVYRAVDEHEKFASGMSEPELSRWLRSVPINLYTAAICGCIPAVLLALVRIAGGLWTFLAG